MIIKRKNKISFSKIFGIFLIIIPLLILLLKKVYYLNNINKDLIQINNYLDETSLNKKMNTNNYANELKESHENRYEELNYIAILEIPEISLKKGLLSPDDKYNDVAYNVTVLPTSKMPNIINSNLILAAHNGTSNVSYFKDLSKLNKGSIINVYYQGTKYSYKLNNYYEINKNGEANIIRDKTINTITLITCKDNSNNLQIVYIAYLISTETY